MNRTLPGLILTIFMSGCQPSTETPTYAPESVFFLVRHSEKVDESEDPPLTDRGRRRAETLRSMLRDSGIGAIYSSDFVRTRDTAHPLAEELGMEIILYDPNELDELSQKLLDSSGRTLIVGHSDTTPVLAGLLGGEPGSEISLDEYDRLYMLVHRAGAGTSTVVLRFEP